MNFKKKVKNKTLPNKTRKPSGEYIEWCGPIDRLAWGGIGLGRDKDGKIVLLSASLALFPGEEVKALVRRKSRHSEGKVTAWIKPDPRRVKPECSFAGICGGCSLLESGVLSGILKKQMVHDLLSRQLPISSSWRWLEAPENARRNRIQLHWDGTKLGFYSPNSYLIVPIQECPAAIDPISKAIPRLRDALEARILSQKPQRWELVAGTPANQVYAVAGSNNIVWQLNTDGWCRYDGPVRHEFKDVIIKHNPGDFFQACPSWAWSAFGDILQGWDLRGSTLFDLYAGVGFFSILLRDRFKKYIIVENNESAIGWGQRNVEDLGLNISCFSSDVEQWMEKSMGIGSSEDLILLDPPRSGLTDGICEKLCSFGATSLILIGCDGATFCRDLKRLEQIWQISDLVAVDLFPMTRHVEFIALLHKKDLADCCV